MNFAKQIQIKAEKVTAFSEEESPVFG